MTQGIQSSKRKVSLRGLRPIMFDRYAGDNTTQLDPGRKMYLTSDGRVCMPAENISSFLAAENTKSCAKIFGGKNYKALASAILGHTLIDPLEILITKDGKDVRFEKFGVGGWRLDERVARLNKGIPNPKKRPVLELPWELEFELDMVKNDFFTEPLLRSFFERGGVMMGLGTFRGVFGKFAVDGWEEV